ncbi:hypothetical protein [Acinetobacter sp. YH12058]|uniref:hypothetical protein n=1 Tax=Acinetobacter sp. YH12058 TaxID=2601058 RepID=UPI0015D35D2C|nr:hypothetical protein [Acinetobacter sp. YH12058]
MAKQYKAIKPVGRFQVGEVVGGLNEDQIKKLVADGVIQEVKPAAVTKKITGDAK